MSFFLPKEAVSPGNPLSGDGDDTFFGCWTGGVAVLVEVLMIEVAKGHDLNGSTVFSSPHFSHITRPEQKCVMSHESLIQIL